MQSLCTGAARRDGGVVEREMIGSVKLLFGIGGEMTMAQWAYVEFIPMFPVPETCAVHHEIHARIALLRNSVKGS